MYNTHCRCGVWALTPQMSSCRMPGSYGRGNPDIDFHYVDALRIAVVRSLPGVIETGQLEWILDCSVQVHILELCSGLV